MTQKTLFDVAPEPIGHHGYPMSRTTDPLSSKVAAAEHREKAGTHRAKILAALQRCDGQTGWELSLETGIGQVEVVRRLADLRNAGHVKDRESDRPCKVRPKSKQNRWFLV